MGYDSLQIRRQFYLLQGVLGFVGHAKLLITLSKGLGDLLFVVIFEALVLLE
jgi:hypothetical protein